MMPCFISRIRKGPFYSMNFDIFYSMNFDIIYGKRTLSAAIGPKIRTNFKEKADLIRTQ